MIGYSFLLAFIIGQCGAKVYEIPFPKNIQECYNKAQSADTRTFVGSLFSWMCESAVKKSQLGAPPTFDAQKMSYYKQLYENSTGHLNRGNSSRLRRKRQAVTSRCVRKEYRMLSDVERRRFHDAINTLKRDTTIEPNKYDAIAILHAAAIFIAHAGAGFLGWHRIYLSMFEAALKQVNPLVCLPYWDSSLDNDLEDPTLSHIWTSEFFGTPQGPVVDGPFANWSTPEGSELMRSAGVDGELFASSTVEDILSRSRYEEIIEVQPQYDLEYHHGGVHIFVGGAMSQLTTAAFDPIFFLHHAYVDYIWELFRTKLRSLGRDPERYPQIRNADPRHLSSAATGFGDLTQGDAYTNSQIESYEYEPSPVCSSSSSECGSRYLTCLERNGRCVPITQSAGVLPQPEPFTTSSPRKRRSPIITSNYVPYEANATCSRSEVKIYGQPVQNNYCYDKSCDTNKWAMIPVKIISVRPPKFTKYQSYPVHNGRVNTTEDIYSPSANTQTNRFITKRLGNPKTYKRCAIDESIGHVFLSSRGINYDGYYKEVAVVDQAQALSISIGFVAVKKPTPQNESHAIIRVHDSCGRVCLAACKDPVTKQYKPCKGAIAVSSQEPLMYGKSYDEAVLKVFDFGINNEIPQFNTESFYLTFYCDYHSGFPYADPSGGPNTTPVVNPEHLVVPTTSVCQVTQQCVLDVPWASESRQCTKYNEKHRCRGSCRTYGLCIYGHYFLRECPAGQHFDEVTKSCVIGDCQPNQGSGVGRTTTMSLVQM